MYIDELEPLFNAAVDKQQPVTITFTDENTDWRLVVRSLLSLSDDGAIHLDNEAIEDLAAASFGSLDPHVVTFRPKETFDIEDFLDRFGRFILKLELVHQESTVLEQGIGGLRRVRSC